MKQKCNKWWLFKADVDEDSIDKYFGNNRGTKVIQI
jgi:hypothetical protein